MLLTDSLVKDVAGVAIALTVIFITYFKWSFTYWKRRNLPYLEPQIPFGNIINPLKRVETIGLSIKRLYSIMKSQKWKHGGIYMATTPTYLVIDLDYVKNILTKDFQYFVDRGVYVNEKDDPLSAHLFAIGGTKWRNLRMKLTPTFTSGKMKMMFPTLLECETFLQERIETSCTKKEAIDIKDVLGCFTTDIIGSCAFGLETNTFKEDDSPFRRYGKKAFSPSIFKRLLIVVMMNFPNLSKVLGLRMFPKDLSDFFMKVVKDTVEYREKNNVTRKDFLQLLIELKNNKIAEEEGYQHDGKSLTIEEIAAQSVLFFLAGFETSSTTMTFALYELSKNQKMQDKVRDEIEAVLARHGGKITYEAIQDMKYMNQVLNETLRKYPPVSFVTRKCVKDYKVPDSDVIIEKGVRVLVPIMGIHYDEEYYPGPEKFDPERFSEENIASRHQYAHIPFGEGPRICIGLRFGLMQSKVGLASLLKRYRFTVNAKTIQPIKFQVNSFILAAEGDIWLNAEKI